MKVLAEARWSPTAEAPRPDLSFVPPLARRRLTALERAALAVAHQVMSPGEEVPVVFASRWGEVGTTLKLMRQLHDEGEMSPAGFSNSVHNAAPGQLSLLKSNHADYTAIAAGPDSYQMGLLEAESRPGRVIFVYAEEDTPEFYGRALGETLSARAVAMLIDNAQ